MRNFFINTRLYLSQKRAFLHIVLTNKKKEKILLFDLKKKL